jgi:hypothetical protein
MTTTTNLSVTHIEAAQAQKEVTANAAFDIFDKAIAGTLSINFASDANRTITDAESLYAVFVFTDTTPLLTTTRDVIFPNKSHILPVKNSTAQTLNIKTAAGASVALAAGNSALMFNNGTGVYLIAGGGTFIALPDTPSTYVGSALKLLRVNGGATGLEFIQADQVTDFTRNWNVPFHGCLLSRGTAQSINDSTMTAISWSTETYDTYAFAEQVTNPTRITIPDGVTRVQLFGGARFDANATGIRSITPYKNGAAAFAGRPSPLASAGDDATTHTLNFVSPVLGVTAGDYFELMAYQTSGGALNVATGDFTYFGIIVVEADWLGIGDFDKDATTTTGLTWGYTGGKIRNDNVITDIAAATIALTDNATNYIEYDPTGGTIGKNTTGFTAGKIPLRQVVTLAGAITTDTDKRAWITTNNSGGATNFLGLTDTPANYTGAAGKGVRVNSGGTGLEFYDIIDPVAMAIALG